ncbi:hypothetical protein B0H34DRAFT_648291, partial [Crassisporium funariophilum]
DKPSAPDSCIDNVCMAQQFIQLISSATLDKDKLEPSTLHRLQNPKTEPVDISDPDTCLSLNLFLACYHALEATYTSVQVAIQHRCPQVDVLSYHSVKKLVANITGVVSVLDNMCINSCNTFTGPLSGLAECPVCSEPQYSPEKCEHFGKNLPQQQACTIPLRPQLQALW